MKITQPIKAIDGKDIKNSEELRVQIKNAVEAISEWLDFLDNDFYERYDMQDWFMKDKMLVVAQIYWLEGLLKVAHIEHAKNQLIDVVIKNNPNT